MDVKFEIQDLFEKLRPNAKIHESMEEAAEALNEIVAKQIKPMGATAENIGEGSDGMSEKSDDEEDDQHHQPLEEDEPEEGEDNREEDTEVCPYMTFFNGRWRELIISETMRTRKLFCSIVMLNPKWKMRNSTANLRVSCQNPSNPEKQPPKLPSTSTHLPSELAPNPQAMTLPMILNVFNSQSYLDVINRYFKSNTILTVDENGGNTH
jgi:hypothetical protein